MYRFVRWGKFQEWLRQVRILNLIGAMGTGKTLLASAVGYELLRRGLVDRVATNYPFGPSAAPSPRFTYAVYDEAGVVFDNRMAFKDKRLNEMSSGLIFGLRKAGSYFVVPSFLEVDKRFRSGMRMWRRFAIGKWLWIYQWEVGEEDAELRRPDVNYWTGSLWFVHPAHFFGTFDTYFVPGRALSIAFLQEMLREWELAIPEEYRTVLG
jgi:hypothetical protein